MINLISFNEIIFRLGIGVNISNSQPSVCLNDAIDQQNSSLNLKHFTIEEFIGRTIGYLQKWIFQLSQANTLQANIALNNFYQFYESHWMHQ